MDRKLIDFIVETGNHCFLCLIKLEPGSASLCSLEDLSRYLKLDRRKVFNEKAPIPPHLLVKVEQSILKAKLCDECNFLNKKLARVLQEAYMDKLQLNATIFLLLFHERMRKAEESGLVEKFRKSIELIDALEGYKNWMGKLSIVETLREDLLQKCHQKVGSFLPHLPIKNLSAEEITEEKRKLKSRSSSIPDYRRVDYPFMEIIVPPGCRNQSSYLKTQYIINAKTRMYTCVQCKNQFSYMSSFKEHFENIHLQIRYRCTLCGDQFSVKCLYTKHHRVAHNGVAGPGGRKKTRKCHICMKAFPTSILANEHVQLVHRGIVDPVCYLCGGNYNSFDDLRQHLWSVHQELPRTRAKKTKGSGRSMDRVTLKMSISSVKLQPAPGLSNEVVYADTSGEIEIGEVKVERIYADSGPENYETDSSENSESRTESSSKPAPEASECDGNEYIGDHDVDLTNADLPPPLPAEIKESVVSQKASRLNKCTSSKLGTDYRKFMEIIRPTDQEQDTPPVSSKTQTGKFRCNRCPKLFLEYAKFLLHFDSAHIYTTYKCMLCGKELKYQRGFRRHYQVTHLGISVPQRRIISDMHKCLLCKNGFAKSIHLRKHLKEAHLPSPEEGESCCKHCGEHFNSIQDIYNHFKKIHEGPRSYICKVCGNGFIHSRSLDKHRRQVNCREITEKKTVQPSVPATPKIKKPERPKVCHCQHCGQGFTKVYNLYKHIRLSHLQIRRYPCEQCEKTFKTASHLKRHVEEVHMKLQQIQCDICKKMFVRKRQLTRHRKNAHPDNP